MSVWHEPTDLQKLHEEQEAAKKKKEAQEKLPETVAALQAAQADADALNIDQAYRLTLLELGISE